MPNYDEKQKELCVNAVKGINSGNFVKHEDKELKTMADIRRAYGPNPKAVGRYCKKAGVELPKRVAGEKKPKSPKGDTAPNKDAAKPAPGKK